MSREWRMLSALADTPVPVPAPRWELAAIGDPLTDLDWLLATWRDEGDAVPPATPGPSDGGGYPDRAVLVQRYRDRAGVDEPDLGFYEAFARWRGRASSPGCTRATGTA